MCVRHQIHRMYCDARPCVAIARQTTDGKPTVRKYVNPYGAPLPCHRHKLDNLAVHDLLKSSTNCPFNGCCRLQTIDLPCDCADEKRNVHWGTAEMEDITRCIHFREYHTYKHRTDPLKQAKRKNHHLMIDIAENKWDDPDLPYLDSWVLLDFEDVNFFCERAVYEAARLEFIQRGWTLLDEFNQAELWQMMVNTKTVAAARVACAQLSEEDKVGIKQGVEKAWKAMREQQEKLWKMNSARTEALLGFSEQDQTCPEQPAVTSGYSVAPFMPKRDVLNPVRLEMQMI
ncbi:hypothetical protein V8F20_011743 [Naviculisporaceae sp. PSN 640]